MYLSLIYLHAGYRHVYLEGMEEASIFVHVAVNDITGKVSTKGGSGRQLRTTHKFFYVVLTSLDYITFVSCSVFADDYYCLKMLLIRHTTLLNVNKVVVFLHLQFQYTQLSPPCCNWLCCSHCPCFELPLSQLLPCALCCYFSLNPYPSHLFSCLSSPSLNFHSLPVSVCDFSGPLFYQTLHLEAGNF